MKKIDLTDFQIATTGVARDINRRIVLNLMRKHQPMSRADLARHSGLQRSTISAIIDELIADRWLLEGAVRDVPRGRKPTFLHLNVERSGIIGIGVRPIATTIVLARLDTSFVAEATIPTRGTPAEFLGQLTRHVKGLIAAHPEIPCEGIGVSVPGRVDQRTHRLVFAPNLRWRDLDLKTPLEKATGLPVQLENAANACALAEIWCGKHAENVRDLVAVTVSEGIGVGMVVNGQVVQGAGGMAGEFGHVSLDESGPLCRCGNRGCWEMYASNLAAVRYYEESLGKSVAKRKSSRMTFSDLLIQSRRGDAKAGEALDRMAHYLGVGLATLVNGFA